MQVIASIIPPSKGDTTMEEPKNVVIIGRKSAKLAKELQNFFSDDEYDVSEYGGASQNAPTVVILLTSDTRYQRVSKKVKELAATGCKVLAINTHNQPWELIVDKASGFLEAIQ